MKTCAFCVISIFRKNIYLFNCRKE